ncbi:RNA polymerase sigma factor [Tuwongella immobilis]|uniref:Uncharacterized protein n=1 Tax=Tuwongella immobilis TaxID=692036 RepID=A0A6C2YHM9_9BACT|nr:sigma-70 family RNA polymerase sigma factor [Tuwongella immobilis]VIP00643.1 rna polymerase sigma70 : RNA polymerase sigma factor Y OS=Rhodopirellula baltica WH47 GN=RBWH47_03830 PE=4 SV=1: Sigma70_r2 [Tuwongella immobilis]VTR96704.1 rna polymerase sigma70 : RNA polymerase sigma factor Y OS=Rhodopirellula baltica WH47 GN=RBWH47_03830 PE=4 SV=1: Sigma70_r2 [Tuwongella immobilis]
MPQADATLRPTDLLGPDAARIWQQLLDRYTPALSRWASRNGWQPADVADLVQQVFMRFWEQLATSKAEEIAIRPALRQLRRTVMKEFRQRRPQDQTATVNWSELSLHQGEGSAFQLCRDPRRRLRFTRMLRRLQWEFEPATWQAFWDTTVKRHPVARVAIALGWPKTEVAVARYRVRQRLLKLLKRMRRRPER